MVTFKIANNGSFFDPGTTYRILVNAVPGHSLDPGSLGITTHTTLSRD